MTLISSPISRRKSWKNFTDLIRALEQVKEYRHNRRFGHPTLLGTVRPLDDILELFAR